MVFGGFCLVLDGFSIDYRILVDLANTLGIELGIGYVNNANNVKNERSSPTNVGCPISVIV